MTIETTLAERGATHGSFEDNARVSQSLKLILHHARTDPLPYAQQEALDMICLKLSRIVTGNPNVRDHWHDIAGYATLIANSFKAPDEV